MALISLLRKTGHLRAQMFSLTTASLTKVTSTASVQSINFSMGAQPAMVVSVL